MCLVCRLNDLKRVVASVRANFWPWIAVPLLVYILLSVLAPTDWQIYGPFVSPKCVLAVCVILTAYVCREVLLPHLQVWRERKAIEMREMRRLQAVEMARWRREATRLCRNCLAQYRDQEPAGGRFMCQQCGHISKRPMLEIPGSRPAEEKLFKQQLSSSASSGSSHPDVLRFSSNEGGCSWLDFCESACPGDHWKLLRNVFCWVVVVLRAIFSFGWLSWLGFEGRDSNGDCKEMRDRKEASSAQRVARMRRRAEEKKLARIVKELEEEEERLQREEVARLVEEQRRARLRDMRTEQGNERVDGRRGEAKRRNAARKAKQSGVCDGQSLHPQGDEKKVDHTSGVSASPGLRCQMLRKDAHHDNIGRTRAAGKGLPGQNVLQRKAGVHLHESQQRSQAPVPQYAKCKQPPCAPSAYRQVAAMDHSSMAPAGVDNHEQKHQQQAPQLSSWKAVVAGGKEPAALAQVLSGFAPVPVAMEDCSGHAGQGPQSPRQERLWRSPTSGSSSEVFETPPCTSPPRPLSPPLPDVVFYPDLPTCVEAARVVSESPPGVIDGPSVFGNSSQPVVDDSLSTCSRQFSSRLPPPAPQRSSVPPLVSSPLKPQEDAMLLRTSPNIGTIGQGAIGQPPLKASLSAEGGSSSAKKSLGFDDPAAVQEQSGHEQHWDIWDSLGLDTLNLVDSVQGAGSIYQGALLFPDGFIEATCLPDMQGIPIPPVPSHPLYCGPQSPAYNEIPALQPLWASPAGVPETAWQAALGYAPTAHDSTKVQGFDSHSVVPNGEDAPAKAVWCPKPMLFKEPSSGVSAVKGFTPETGKLEGLYVPADSASGVHLGEKGLAASAASWAEVRVDHLPANPWMAPDTWVASLEAAEEISVPPEFVDCITREIMVDPVITADGHSYERSSILAWLRDHDTSPLTGQVLPKLPSLGMITHHQDQLQHVDKSLRPNHALRSQIMEYRERLSRGWRAQAGHARQAL